MLDEGVLCLYEINFAFIGLLPVVFFRRGGRLNSRWWLAAAPFFVCPVFLLAAHLGHGQLSGLSAALLPWKRWLAVLAVPFAAASIALIGFTLGTHRVPIALWHQPNDAPASIVTWGAYRRVRHPFYAAFLLALLGAFLFHPHPVTLATLFMGLVILNLTAAQEERRLSRSSFGADYAAYMARTGRFLPRRAR